MANLKNRDYRSLTGPSPVNNLHLSPKRSMVDPTTMPSSSGSPITTYKRKRGRRGSTSSVPISISTRDNIINTFSISSVVLIQTNGTKSSLPNMTFSDINRMWLKIYSGDSSFKIRITDIKGIKYSIEERLNVLAIIFELNKSVSLDTLLNDYTVKSIGVSFQKYNNFTLKDIFKSLKSHMSNSCTYSLLTDTEKMSLFSTLFFHPKQTFVSSSPLSSPERLNGSSNRLNSILSPKEKRYTRSLKTGFTLKYENEDVSDDKLDELMLVDNGYTQSENIPEDQQIIYSPNLKIKFSDKSHFTISNSDFNCLYNGNWINDSIVDFFLHYELQTAKSDPGIKHVDNIEILNSFFYTSLSRPVDNDDYYQNVKSWFKNKSNLFDRDYVIIPIMQDLHWYVVILKNLRKLKRQIITTQGVKNEDDKDKSVLDDSLINSQPDSTDSFTEITDLSFQDSKPFMMRRNSASIFCLDSLRKKHDVLGKILKSFIVGYAKDKYNITISTSAIIKYDCRVPKQNNFNDCGVHVIFNINKFLSNVADFDRIILRQKTKPVLRKAFFDSKDRWKMREVLREKLLSLLKEQILRDGGDVSKLRLTKSDLKEIDHHDHDDNRVLSDADVDDDELMIVREVHKASVDTETKNNDNDNNNNEYEKNNTTGSKDINENQLGNKVDSKPENSSMDIVTLDSPIKKKRVNSINLNTLSNSANAKKTKSLKEVIDSVTFINSSETKEKRFRKHLNYLRSNQQGKKKTTNMKMTLDSEDEVSAIESEVNLLTPVNSVVMVPQKKESKDQPIKSIQLKEHNSPKAETMQQESSYISPIKLAITDKQPAPKNDDIAYLPPVTISIPKKLPKPTRGRYINARGADKDNAIVIGEKYFSVPAPVVKENQEPADMKKDTKIVETEIKTTRPKRSIKRKTYVELESDASQESEDEDHNNTSRNMQITDKQKVSKNKFTLATEFKTNTPLLDISNNKRRKFGSSIAVLRNAALSRTSNRNTSHLVHSSRGKNNRLDENVINLSGYDDEQKVLEEPSPAFEFFTR